MGGARWRRSLSWSRWLRERQGPARSRSRALARLRSGAPGAGACGCATLPVVLAALGLVTGSVVALARPQHGTLAEDVTTQGVDIVVALDVSGSMAAEDFQPRNRLSRGEGGRRRVREAARAATASAWSCSPARASPSRRPPRTPRVLLRQLEDVRLEMLPDGTAIGSGLATSLTRLRRSQGDAAA